MLYLQLVDEQHLLLLWLPTKAHYFISSKQKNPLTFGLEGLYNSNVIYIYPTSVSSNNAQLPPQIRFGWLQIVCVKDALIVNIYLIFKKSNLISKYATSSHAPVNTSLIKLLLSGKRCCPPPSNWNVRCATVTLTPLIKWMRILHLVNQL